MYNGADLKPVLDGGETVKGAYSTPDGRVVFRRKIVVDGQIVTRMWEAYTRLGPDGEPLSMFEFPLSAKPEERTVSRKASGGASDLEEDLYLSKRALNEDGTTRQVFRYTTPADVIALRALTRKNEIADQKRRENNTPMAQNEAMGKAIANSLAGVLTGGNKGQRAVVA